MTPESRQEEGTASPPAHDKGSSADFYLFGKHIGSVLYHEYVRFSISHPHLSIAFVCDICGELWARRDVAGSARWLPEARKCPVCGPGFLLHYGDPKILEISPALAARELKLALSPRWEGKYAHHLISNGR